MLRKTISLPHLLMSLRRTHRMQLTDLALVSRGMARELQHCYNNVNATVLLMLTSDTRLRHVAFLRGALCRTHGEASTKTEIASLPVFFAFPSHLKNYSDFTFQNSSFSLWSGTRGVSIFCRGIFFISVNQNTKSYSDTVRCYKDCVDHDVTLSFFCGTEMQYLNKSQRCIVIEFMITKLNVDCNLWSP